MPRLRAQSYQTALPGSWASARPRDVTCGVYRLEVPAASLGLINLLELLTGLRETAASLLKAVIEGTDEQPGEEVRAGVPNRGASVVGELGAGSSARESGGSEKEPRALFLGFMEASVYSPA